MSQHDKPDTDERDNAPLPIGATPDVVDSDLEALLAEPFAQVWRHAPGAGTTQAVRTKLLGRLALSRAAEARMITRRRRSTPREVQAPGVSVQKLYEADDSADGVRSLRPGEPLRVRLIELGAGARWTFEAGAEERHRELLVLSGSVTLDDEKLSLRDYRVVPAGHASPVCRSANGALLFVREAAFQDDAPPHTVRDAEAGWPAFAPGIRRRVLWQRGSEAALLYHADAGASVPVHTHGHDEECLMVQGELFLDDLLLQHGDWQLAPAGTGHRITATDTGVVIYAHGDLDLQFTG